ncbi:hypothetical protein RFI_39744, partial [Reticulomyxa filosa]
KKKKKKKKKRYEINIAHFDRAKLTNLIAREYEWLTNNYHPNKRRTFVEKVLNKNDDSSAPSEATPIVPVKDLETLFYIFDTCISDMFAFLRQSFLRFRYTPEYVTLCQNLIKKWLIILYSQVHTKTFEQFSRYILLLFFPSFFLFFFFE